MLVRVVAYELDNKIALQKLNHFFLIKDIIYIFILHGKVGLNVISPNCQLCEQAIIRTKVLNNLLTRVDPQDWTKTKCFQILYPFRKMLNSLQKCLGNKQLFVKELA